MLIIPLNSKIADNKKDTTDFIISFWKLFIPAQISTPIIKVYNMKIIPIKGYLTHLLTFLSSKITDITHKNN